MGTYRAVCHIDAVREASSDHESQNMDGDQVDEEDIPSPGRHLQREDQRELLQSMSMPVTGACTCTCTSTCSSLMLATTVHTEYLK